MNMAAETSNFGHNNPMHTHRVVWDGHRSIRFDSGEGLATVAYSYKLSHWEMIEMAERIALALNAVAGLTNDQIRGRSIGVEAGK